MATMTPEDGLKIGLAGLFKSEEFSDFTIKCGPYEFKIHKAVICAQSEYFKAACRSNSFKEGDANLVTLDTSDEDDPSCDDPEAVKRMIHFFYHLDYEVESPGAADLAEMSEPIAPFGISPTPQKANPPTLLADIKTFTANKTVGGADENNGTKSETTAQDSIALAHAKVLAAAVKYHVLPLRCLATAKFQATVADDSTLPGFAKTITAVYATTPEDALELRDIISDTLTRNTALLSKDGIKKAVCKVPELSFDLLRKGLGRAEPHKTTDVKAKETPEKTRCSICGCGRHYPFPGSQHCHQCGHPTATALNSTQPAAAYSA